MLQDTVNQGRAAELARDQKRGISTGPQAWTVPDSDGGAG